MERLMGLEPGRPCVRLLQAKLLQINGDDEEAKTILASVLVDLEEADSSYLPAQEANALAKQWGM